MCIFKWEPIRKIQFHRIGLGLTFGLLIRLMQFQPSPKARASYHSTKLFVYDYAVVCASRFCISFLEHAHKLFEKYLQKTRIINLWAKVFGLAPLTCFLAWSRRRFLGASARSRKHQSGTSLRDTAITQGLELGAMANLAPDLYIRNQLISCLSPDASWRSFATRLSLSDYSNFMLLLSCLMLRFVILCTRI